jgi:malate dehydrogenase
MTREDLLKGNAEIAAQLGKDVRSYCPNAKLVVIIFNPADVTGLVTQVHSGLAPGHVTTLAALDSTRLQTALSQHFKVPQDDVTGCRTYGGHGEMMAVFASTAKVSGKALSDLIGTPALTNEAWEGIKEHVRQGGKRIIQLRGRSSFQSPSHQSVMMVKAAPERRPLGDAARHRPGARRPARVLRAPDEAARRGRRDGASTSRPRLGEGESAPRLSSRLASPC